MKSKKVLIVIAFLLLAFLMSFNPVQAEEEEMVVKEYEELTITHPANWLGDVDESENELFVYIYPREEFGEEFTANVNFIVSELQTDVNWERFVELSIEGLSKQIEDFELLEEKEYDLDGREAVMLEFTGNLDDGKDLQWLQVLALEGGREYIITYTAPRERFAKYQEEAARMMDELEIKPINPQQ